MLKTNKIRSTFLRNLILPMGDLALGQSMISRLKFLEKAQWWSKEDIFAWQNKELVRLIHIAYKEVPFYHHLFDEAGVRPADIQSTLDLQRLPVVTKDMLRKNYPHSTTRDTGQRTYEASTSGSTGKNFFVMEDARTAGWYRATFLLELEWAGWLIGEPHLQTGMTLDRSIDRRLKDWLLGCHYASAYNLDDEHLEMILSTMERYHLNHLWGYPGSLYYLANYAKKRGWNYPLKSAVTWGDTLFPGYRKKIEDVFKTKVFDTYGCAEGFHISAQCEYGNYHIHALDTIVEFLNGDGLPVKPGNVGDIVITRLHPGPMPFIRYAIGDLGVPSGERTCPCGRGFPLMDSIQGRTADVVITPEGNRLIVHFFTGVLEHFPEIDSFQVLQEKIDSIILLIVPRSQINGERRAEIIQALKEKGTGSLIVDLEIVPELKLSPSGKRRFVINKLENLNE